MRLDHRIEHLLNALAGLGRDPQDVVGISADQLEPLRRAVGIGLRQVDLVHDRQQLEVVLDREVGVRDFHQLFDSCAASTTSIAPSACNERETSQVKSTWPGCRSVEPVALPRNLDGLRLDCDATLMFEFHRVEHLLAHLTAGDGVGQLEDAVGQGRFPVVDVRDDREVADVVLLHGTSPCRARRAAGADSQR